MLKLLITVFAGRECGLVRLRVLFVEWSLWLRGFYLSNATVVPWISGRLRSLLMRCMRCYWDSCLPVVTMRMKSSMLYFTIFSQNRSYKLFQHRSSSDYSIALFHIHSFKCVTSHQLIILLLVYI
ncbi:uncharacterized protein C8R40DRAFT_835566 [Lentinula edodes]|uniref:uncharacterized protein n=1 Tax=Lentinula edodes TaxID=5353 RepID=UPI001E8E38EE|nr:uncharacterized protein C8R40DRAFT_835566 [Lentinula edodes]KAH7878342.1 hypothetical protein C8R40DRAFT_835566 [Lentinula edodes]